MKQITGQQFANIFGMYVAKDESDTKTYAHEEKPNLVYLESYWFSHKKVMDITKLISDADILDWNVLIEPEHVQFSLIPFDEKNAPIYLEGEFLYDINRRNQNA